MADDIDHKSNSSGRMASGTSQLCSLLIMVDSSADQKKEEQLQMSREEKEKLLNQKMENIRRKNEELRKRHQEIEADKKNADIFSSTVTMDEVKPYVMKIPRSRPERPDKPREMLDQPQPLRPADIMPSRQRLSENDGPPPDPSYRFLSDPDRDGIEGGRENKREQWGRGGRGRGRRGGRGGGGGAWEGSGGGAWEGSGEDGIREGTSDRGDRGGRGSGRGSRGGYSVGEGENDVKADSGQAEAEFWGRSDRGFNRGRGRGRNNGNFSNSDGERRYEHGRGGRGRGNERSRLENENLGSGDGADGTHSGGSGGHEGRRGKFSFTSRDIRYYPDDDGDQRIEKGSRGRGRGNYSQRHSFDDYEDMNRMRERGRGRGHFEHRGRGRGRARGQHHEYERWKAEREAIDEERIIRGRTHEGAWRREWDNDKLDQGEVEDTEPVYDPRYPRSKCEGLKLGDFVTIPSGDDGDSSPPQSGQPRGHQGDRRPTGGRGSRSNYKGRNRYPNPEINAQRHEEEIMAELDPDAVFRERKIEGHGDSFTISVSTANHSTAGKFVRVGSGRRGKPGPHAGAKEQRGEDIESYGGERQHQRIRGFGNRNSRGRGRGQGYNNFTNKENSVPNWSKSTVVDGQVGVPSDSSMDSKIHQRGIVATTPPASCPTQHHQLEEFNEPGGQAANFTSPDLPADDLSWTDATSGNESLDTSALSQEGADLVDTSQDDEDLTVQEIMQSDQFVSTDHNASIDEVNKDVETETYKASNEDCEIEKNTGEEHCIDQSPNADISEFGDEDKKEMEILSESGNMRVIHSDQTEVPENMRVIHSDQTEVPENMRVIHSDQTEVPENMRVIHSDQTEVPENMRVIHSDQTEVPENMRVIHSDQTEVPENMRVIHSDQTEVPENMRVIHSDQTEDPENMRVIHNDLTEDPENMRVIHSDQMEDPETVRVIHSDQTEVPENMRIIHRDLTEDPENMTIIHSDQTEVLAVEFKVSTDETFLSEDKVETDSTTSVIKQEDEEKTNLLEELGGENDVSKEEIITDVTDEKNSDTVALKETHTEMIDKDVSEGCQEEESSQKEDMVSDKDATREDDDNERKKPESRLTPASSPTTTEQLVPNIEWK
ncbi:uncharacterized protein LOC121861023 isoform X1 [Homarus americanus]|uniref:uncharacterized protein LOC121861023 isoform X1 n=1 Tax=Homarus americanus TaxID=6706 RepID=UPI001C44B8D9|nr:uncharacterized protein LOC121861023 isoform X1 [Homarus americanus]